MIYDDELLLEVKSNPSVIWQLDFVDELIFEVAIDSDPTSVFDVFGSLHSDFDPDKYHILALRVIELIAGCSVLPESESYYEVCLKAASKDWRILNLIPNPGEDIQLAAIRNNRMAIDSIDELTPGMQLLALQDAEGMDRVLFRCGDLTDSVIKEAKAMLLEKIKSFWDPEYIHPYVEKYLLLANDQEVHDFFGDAALSESVCIGEFVVEPSITVKQHLISRDGIEYYLQSAPDDWTFSGDLEIWAARLLNRDDPSLRPEIFYFPSPSKHAKLAFVSSLLGVQEVDGELNEPEVVTAIEMLKFPEQACWLCWAFGEEVTDSVGRALVAKLCGSTIADMGQLSTTHRNSVLDLLAGHYADQDISAVLLILGKVFPEIALFQATVENLFEDLGECCKELKRVLPAERDGLLMGPHKSVPIPELERLMEGVF